MREAVPAGSAPAAERVEPSRDCPLCPRLAAYRAGLRDAHPGWHNAPVPPFGPAGAPLLVVGLAPGVGGANRSGRAFTGDGAGQILYPALAAAGLSRGRFEARADDGLELTGCRIANAVRCVPPQNKPTPAEARTCRRFLEGELLAPPAPRAVLALGRIAFESVLRALGLGPARHRFAHGSVHRLPGGRPVLVASYHCSRYNVNTGLLTPAMFAAALALAVDAAAEGAPAA